MQKCWFLPAPGRRLPPVERQQEETYLGRVPSGHNCLLCGQLRPRQMLGGKPLAATRLLCTKGPGPGGQAAMIRATPPSGPPLSSTSEPTLDLSLAQRVTWGSCQQPHQPPPWAFLHLPSKAHPDQPTPPRGPTPERRADLSRVCTAVPRCRRLEPVPGASGTLEQTLGGPRGLSARQVP